VKVFTYIKNDSSRINKKNFIELGDLPLWKHLIYELSELCDVFIDTDSQEIIDQCASDKKLKNVHAYKRDQVFINMENDPENKLSPALLMVENFLNKFVEDDNEIIVLTHVTSPFLKKETIKCALKKLELGYDSIHSVTCKQDFAWLESFNKPINFDPKVVQRTQDLSKIYFSNGAFFIFSKKTFIENKHRFGKNNFLYEIDDIEGIEIDNMKDYKLAQIIFKGVKGGSN